MATASFLAMDLDTVTIRLESTELVVYKALLTAVSSYFKKAFYSPFQEATQRAIILEGVSEKTFRIFLHWAYVQTLNFDTTSAALDHSALLQPDEVKKLETALIEDIPATDESNNEAADNHGGDGDGYATWLPDAVTPIAPAFDEPAFHVYTGFERRYAKNKEWPCNVELFHLSLCKLFILADKYSVPQLRDDTLTALVGQCWK